MKLSPGIAHRYIITEQALQEGWDCSFAYVLRFSPTRVEEQTDATGRANFAATVRAKNKNQRP